MNPGAEGTSNSVQVLKVSADCPVARSITVTLPVSRMGWEHSEVSGNCESKAPRSDQGGYVTGKRHRPRAVVRFGVDGGGRAAWVSHSWFLTSVRVRTGG